MSSSTEKIKDLLKNYNFYLMQVKSGIGGASLKGDMEFLENSILALTAEERLILSTMYIEKMGVKGLAKRLFVHSKTLYRRVGRIVNLIARVYQMKSE